MGSNPTPSAFVPACAVRIGGHDLTTDFDLSILSRHLALRALWDTGGGSVWVPEQATLAQSAEQAPCKRWVVGSNPTGGSHRTAHVAQTAEHTLGKGEVKGSIPFVGSTGVDCLGLVPNGSGLNRTEL